MDLPMVCCDKCDRWIHTECDDIDDEQCVVDYSLILFHLSHLHYVIIILIPVVPLPQASQSSSSQPFRNFHQSVDVHCQYEM